MCPEKRIMVYGHKCIVHYGRMWLWWSLAALFVGSMKFQGHSLNIWRISFFSSPTLFESVSCCESIFVDVVIVMIIVMPVYLAIYSANLKLWASAWGYLLGSMSDEVRKLFRIKGRSPEQTPKVSTSLEVTGGAAATKRNIFQKCISHDSSSSSPSPTLPNHHHPPLHVQSTSSHESFDTSISRTKPTKLLPPKPQLPPRPATVACSRTPVLCNIKDSQKEHKLRPEPENVRPNSVPPQVSLISSAGTISTSSNLHISSASTRPCNISDPVNCECHLVCLLALPIDGILSCPFTFICC